MTKLVVKRFPNISLLKYNYYKNIIYKSEKFKNN